MVSKRFLYILEIMFTPEEFAAALIADLDTPDSHEFAPVIRQQILEQIAQYSQMDCDSLQDPGEEIKFEYSVVRVVVKVSNQVFFTNQFFCSILV